MAGIVVGVDGSRDADAALVWALATARQRSSEVTAILAWAADDCPTVVLERAFAPGGPSVEIAAEQVLRNAIRAARGAVGPVEVVARTVYRDADAALLDAAAGADLLVVGHRGADPVQRLVMGSVSAACLRRATAPVVVVRAAGPPTPGAPVVVGVDGSATSVDTVRWAAEEAALREATLRVVHALGHDGLPGEQAHAVLSDSLAAAMIPGDQAVDTRLVVDDPADALLAMAADAQLLVVGARRRPDFDGPRLGSVSERCVRRATCPVAVVPHRPGHAGPG